jgi:hypothetical protein
VGGQEQGQAAAASSKQQSARGASVAESESERGESEREGVTRTRRGERQNRTRTTLHTNVFLGFRHSRQLRDGNSAGNRLGSDAVACVYVYVCVC